MRFLFSLFALCLLGRAIQIALSSMSWGLMDDVGWVHGFLNGSFSWSFIEFVSSKIHQDLGWGLFRPVYWAWAYLVYGVLGVKWGVAPRWIYLFCFGIYSFLAWGFSRRVDARSRGLAFFSFWAFIPSLYLVSAISLQERLVLLSVLGALWAPHTFLAFVLFVLALGSKSTAVVFALPIAAQLWSRARWGAYAVLATALGWAILAKSVASRGSYTARYFTQPLSEQVLGYFKQGGPWALIVPALLILASLILFLRWKRKELVQNELRVHTAWIVSTAALLLLMLPWGIRGYYWTIFAPGVVMGWVVIASGLRSARMRRALVAVLVLGAFLSVGPKLGRLIRLSVQTGEVVQWLKTDPAALVSQVLLPEGCSESAGSLALLAERDASSVSVWRAGNAFSECSNLIFAANSECPEWPASVPGRKLEAMHQIGEWRFARCK